MDHTACISGCTTNNTPRQAEYGLLCPWCWQRLNHDIAAIPDLITHLREIGEPHAQAAPPSDTRSHGDPAESTVLPAAWIEADYLESLVASWVHVILDEHPNQPMRGPNAKPWHGDQNAGLTTQQDWCATHERADEMRREPGRNLATLRARWPSPDMTEHDRPVPGIKCPRCDRISLTYAPPSYHTQPFKVSCDNPDCARVFTEDEWTRLVGLIAQAERKTA